MKEQKGITLLALVITIIVLLVLASVTINTMVSNKGLVSKSQEAKFKMEAGSYKEKAYVKAGAKSQQVIKVNHITDLGDKLEAQMRTYEKAAMEAKDNISLIQTAEGTLSETNSILQRMRELMTQYLNNTFTDEDIKEMKKEMSQLKDEIDRIAETTMFDDKILLDGTYKYIAQFGDTTNSQGSMEISISNMGWKGIYGEDEIDYALSQDSLDKIDKAIEKVSQQRSSLGAKQNRLEHTVNYIDELNSNIYDLANYVFSYRQVTLAAGAYSARDGISMVKTAEGALVETHSMLQRMHELMTQWANGTNLTDSDKEKLKNEMEQLKDEINTIVKNTKFYNKTLLDGSLNADVQIGFTYDEGNNVSVSINSMDWKSIYGTDKIDYTKPVETITNIQTALEKVSKEREKLGTKQNKIEEEYEKQLDKRYEATADKETATANANSWNTTIGFITIARGAIGEVDSCLLRMQELVVQAANDTNTDSDRQAIQYEIDALVEEIERELKYCNVANRSLLQGNLSYIKQIDTVKLGIKGISVKTRSDALKTDQTITNAQNYLMEIDQLLRQKASNLQKVKNDIADAGYAFDVIDTALIGTNPDEVNEKLSDKFSIINGVLYYTGNDEQEKQWAEQLEISILN